MSRRRWNWTIGIAAAVERSEQAGRDSEVELQSIRDLMPHADLACLPTETTETQIAANRIGHQVGPSRDAVGVAVFGVGKTEQGLF